MGRDEAWAERFNNDLGYRNLTTDEEFGAGRRPRLCGPQRSCPVSGQHCVSGFLPGPLVFVDCLVEFAF
ncbi:MAG: hypothetical protein ACE1ZX_04915, partial [Acidimicrobiia bacterium]